MAKQNKTDKKPSIEELKVRLLATRERMRQHCPSAVPEETDAFPKVSLNEVPGIMDDDVFHKDEDLSVTVGIAYQIGNKHMVDPVPAQKVIFRYADGSIEELVTDRSGKVVMRNPRPVGQAKLEVPGIMVYSDGAILNIVE